MIENIGWWIGGFIVGWGLRGFLMNRWLIKEILPLIKETQKLVEKSIEKKND